MKGMAEGGTMAPPATIANAVADALSDAGVDVDAVVAYPLTAPKVFALLQTASRDWVRLSQRLKLLRPRNPSAWR